MRYPDFYIFEKILEIQSLFISVTYFNIPMKAFKKINKVIIDRF